LFSKRSKKRREASSLYTPQCHWASLREKACVRNLGCGHGAHKIRTMRISSQRRNLLRSLSTHSFSQSCPDTSYRGNLSNPAERLLKIIHQGLLSGNQSHWSRSALVSSRSIDCNMMEGQWGNNSHLESVASLRSIWNSQRTVCYRIDTNMDNDATHNTSQQVAS
jgi:hypothetical protein